MEKFSIKFFIDFLQFFENFFGVRGIRSPDQSRGDPPYCPPLVDLDPPPRKNSCGCQCIRYINMHRFTFPHAPVYEFSGIAMIFYCVNPDPLKANKRVCRRIRGRHSRACNLIKMLKWIAVLENESVFKNFNKFCPKSIFYRNFQNLKYF